jgi:hypothetical protein
MAINFVQHTRQESAKVAGYRRLVMGITTSVLVLYIVAVSGLIGWYMYLGNKQVNVSNDVDTLQKKINGKSEEEVVARKIASRTKVVNEFLGSKQNIAGQAAIIKDSLLIPVDWEINSGTNQQVVKVSGSGIDTLDYFINYMKDRFVNVRMEATTWDNVGGWHVKVSYSGEKPNGK